MKCNKNILMRWLILMCAGLVIVFLAFVIDTIIRHNDAIINSSAVIPVVYHGLWSRKAPIDSWDVPRSYKGNIEIVRVGRNTLRFPDYRHFRDKIADKGRSRVLKVIKVSEYLSPKSHEWLLTLHCEDRDGSIEGIRMFRLRYMSNGNIDFYELLITDKGFCAESGLGEFVKEISPVSSK